MLPTQLRFRDLKARGIVTNWVTLNAWIENENFPPGRLVAANTRLWDEPEVLAWLESRPSARKPAPVRRKGEGVAAA
jgi:hypothetical protein